MLLKDKGFKVIALLVILMLAGAFPYLKNYGQVKDFLVTPAVSNIPAAQASPQKIPNCPNSGGYDLLLFGFNMDLGNEVTLELQQVFTEQGISLSTKTSLTPSAAGDEWQLNDGFNGRQYTIRKESGQLNVYVPNFPPEPDLPGQPNVDICHDAYDSETFYPKPLSENKIERIKLQRLYDIFSWQSFLALNWVVDGAGKQINPLWTPWKNAHEVFKLDGSPPSDWGGPKELPTHLDNSTLPEEPTTDFRILFGLSTTSSLDTDNNDNPGNNNLRLLQQVTQAFSSPLWDQNGNFVYYEILINEFEFDYIRNNNLYNLDGQIAYSKDHPNGIVFGPGTIGNAAEVGPVELKLAWKIIDPSKGDIPERFYTEDAYIYTEGETWEKVMVGLAGMHIAHKTLSSAQWVWSTFEHVDNLQVDAQEVITYAQQGQQLKPSFYDPDCPTCPVNIPPDADLNGVRKTQVMRVIPISKATAQLNEQMHDILKNQTSVWQYYELINTQYSTDPLARAIPAGHGFNSILSKSPGQPTPVYLINSVMETYFQKGNQLASSLEAGPSLTDSQIVFGTESCMGCHYSAGIATEADTDPNGNKKAVFQPGTADFSWIFQMKAHWDQSKQ